MSLHSNVKRVTTHVLSAMKLKGEKIAMLTAYDFSFATLLDEAGIDVILVGEMRDLETTHIAIETAETGHLVFGTLHTTGAQGTVNRIIDVFPTSQQDQIRTQLSTSIIANEKPTASASMLVATESITMVMPLVGSLLLSSSRSP